jgi:hypothetical protein
MRCGHEYHQEMFSMESNLCGNFGAIVVYSDCDDCIMGQNSLDYVI